MAIPSYETFRELVKKDMRRFDVFSEMSSKELDAYLREPDSEGEIRGSYEHSLSQFKNGEFPESVWRQGCVYAVSNCLHEMYWCDH